VPPVVTEDPGADALIESYTRAWESIVARQRALIDDPLAATKRARLAEMQAEISRQMSVLNEETDGYVSRHFPANYEQAMAAGHAAAGGSSFVFTQADRQAAQLLAQNLLHDLVAANLQVVESTRGLIRQIGRDAALRSVLQGDTARQASREMRRLLADHGIHAVTYANGTRVGLKGYAEMVVRSQTAVAYNQAALGGAESAGCTYFEVFDGPSCGWEYHDSPTIANGLVLPQDQAMAYPISHPNCRRSFGPRPDVRTPADAKASSSSTLPSQTEAQIAQDTARGLPTRQELAQRRADAAAGRVRPPRPREVPRAPADRVQAALARRQDPTAAVQQRAAKAQQRAAKAETRGQAPAAPTAAPAEPRFTHMTADQFGAAWDAAGFPPMTAAQTDAVERYTVALHRDWNARLREGKAPTKPIKDLRQAMQPSPVSVTVARTVNLDAFGVERGGVEAVHRQLNDLLGQQVEDRGFLSTTLNTKQIGGREFRGDVYMEIDVPRGTRSRWAEPVTSIRGENELLLDAGTRLEIYDIQVTPNPTEVGDIAGKWATVRARVVAQDAPLPAPRQRRG